MSETEIIHRLKQGNEQAFRELVDKYRNMVVNTCFGLLHNLHDAEDVAQDVFIEAFKSIHKFRADARLSTWLYRIAVNRSLNFIRDNKKRRWFQSFEEVVKSSGELVKYDAPDNSENPESNIETKQRSVILHEAIDSLPENQRIAFTLNKYEDLSYKEISEVMQVSVSSVESLIHRAKKNLQQKLYRCFKNSCL